MSTPVRIERAEATAEVVLDRPARRNAIDGPLATALRDAVRSAAAEDGVHVLLLRGADGAFCSGLDLKAFAEEPPPPWRAGFADCWLDVHAALFDCPKPIVVALERFAINGGAALALAGDLLVAGETSFLQVGEIQQGMAAPMNLGWLRLRHPESVAAQIALTGRRFAGADLHRLGVACDVVADADVLSHARALAREIAGHPPAGARRIKAGLRGAPADAGGRAWFEAARSRDPLPGGAGLVPRRARA